jgi:hypothetical protein
VQVVVDHDLVDSFCKFYDSLTEEMRGYFSYENARLRIGDISKIDKPYSTIKELLDSINKQCVEKLVEEQTKDNDGKGQFLSTYREQLFSLFKNNPGERDKLENWILQVELYETFLSYFYDLLDLYNSKAYGFWLCRKCDDFRLDLSSIDYPASETDRYTHKIENVFKTDDLHLCAWIQHQQERSIRVGMRGVQAALAVGIQRAFHRRGLVWRQYPAEARHNYFLS